MNQLKPGQIFVLFVILSLAGVAATVVLYGNFDNVLENTRKTGNVVTTDKDKLDKLITQYTAKLDISPDDGIALVELGKLYYFRGTDYYQKALNNLHRATELGMLDPQIFLYEALIYEQMKLTDYSEKAYDKYLRNVHNDHKIRLRYANMLFRQGKIDDAIDHYELVYSQKPKNSEVLYNLALAYLKKGMIEDSAAMWELNLKLHKSLPPGGYYYLATIREKQGNKENAKLLYYTEIKHNPDYKPAVDALKKLE